MTKIVPERSHPGPPEEMRCDCGNLLARLVPAGVELKCRRCKRNVLLPLAKDQRVQVR